MKLMREEAERINLTKYGFVRAPEKDFSDDGNRFTCYWYDPNHTGDQRIRLSKLVADGDAYLSARYRNENGRYKSFDDLNGVPVRNAIEGLPKLVKDLDDFLANIDEFDKVEHLDDEQLAGLAEFAVRLIKDADLREYDARNKALEKSGYNKDTIAKEDIQKLDNLIRNQKGYDKEKLAADVKEFIKDVIKATTSYSYGYGRDRSFHNSMDITKAMASASWRLREYPDEVQKRIFKHVEDKFNALYDFKDEALTEAAIKLDINSLVNEIIADLEDHNLTETLVEDYNAREYTDMLYDFVEDGIVDAKSLVQDLMYWVSEDDIHEYMRVNDLLVDDEEELDEAVEDEEDIDWTLPLERDADDDLWSYIYSLVAWTGTTNWTQTVPETMRGIGRRRPEDFISTDSDGNIVIYSDDIEDFDRAKEVAKRFELQTKLLDNKEEVGYKPVFGRRYEFTIVIPEDKAEMSIKKLKREKPEIFK